MTRTFFNHSHERWANLHPFIRFIIFAGLLAGIGLIAVKPGYRAFKGWRIEQNLESARKAVNEERMGEARDLSLTVLRSGDPRIDAYRILEKSTASLRDPRHGDIARALMSHPQGNDEDRLEGFRSVAADMPLGVVGQAWSSLAPDLQMDARFAVIFAHRLIIENHASEAAMVLVKVPEEDRDDALKMALVRVLIHSGRKEGFSEAQRLISKGSSADGADTTAWLDLLEDIPAVSLRGELLESIREYLESARTVDPARAALIIARMDYANQYARRAAVLDETIEKWKEAAPLPLASFLNHLGLHRLLLETFPVGNLAQHPELFHELLEAAEQAGEWGRVSSLMESGCGNMSKLDELAHRTVLISHTADAAELSLAWSAAMDEAAGSASRDSYLSLQRIAREAGLNEQAEQAMVEAIRRGRGPLPLYTDLKPLLASLQQQGRENNLLEISAAYLQFEPGNPVLLTQYAYLACLNNLADPGMILKAVEPMAKAFPKEVPMQCVLAAIYLCGGMPAKAAETLDPLELDPAQMPPPYRMTMLATRVLNGKMAADDPLILEFPWKSLLPSERRKFSELIRNAGRKK